MLKITVLLALQLRMILAVVMRILERQPDMDVVSEVSGPSELRVGIPATEAQVVILTVTDSHL